jgi:hypothetical protein
MAISHLESLVLRVVSVLRDGPAVGLRLGSYEGKAQTQATPISMRHPSLGEPTFVPETKRPQFPTATNRGNCAAPWAGRLSRAGVLGRRSLAQSAGRTNVHRWSETVGEPQFTAAVRLCLPWAKHAAPVADVLSMRPSDLHDIAYQRPGAGRDRQTRTLTAASTRGNGDR